MRHGYSNAVPQWIFFAEDGGDGAAAPGDGGDTAAEETNDDAAAPAGDGEEGDGVETPAPADGEGGDEVEDSIENASDDEIEALEQTLAAEFSELYDAGSPDATATARMAEIADDIDSLRTERSRRQAERAEQQRVADELKSRITPVAAATDEVIDPVAVAEVPVAPVEEPVLEPIAAAATPAPKQTRPKRRGLSEIASQARAHAPIVTIEPTADHSNELVITAAAEVANIMRGGQLSDLSILASAAMERARVLSDMSGRVQVAQIRRTFEHTIDRTMSADQIMNVMNAAANPAVLRDNLVASGGWCAPNIPLFNFFNIAAEDGLLDLPTVGIERAGIQWPVSPSLGDFLGTDSVWNWTETDDQAASTGSPTKPCVHVPCPELDEERLEADGICVTAGFIQEAAWPELVENHLALTMSAHVHTLNQSHLLKLQALSTAVTITEDGVGALAPVLTAIDLQAIDYREKYGMEEDALLEVVLPRWFIGAARSDMAYRPGVDMLDYTKQRIVSDLQARNVRVQFVTDWQTRGVGLPGGGTALTSFPGTVMFMIFAAGTFVRGNGPKIDLGIIRDSTLNETNDFTLAWSEEATLIAMIGHESRIVTVDICPSGAVGIGTTITCA